MNTCNLYTSSHRTGLKYFPYTYTLFNGLVTADGSQLRGSDGEGRLGESIPALATPTAKVCCGQRRV